MSEAQKVAIEIHKASDFARSIIGIYAAIRGRLDGKKEMGIVGPSGFVALVSEDSWEEAERALTMLPKSKIAEAKKEVKRK
jgi:hypothetical protein